MDTTQQTSFQPAYRSLSRAEIEERVQLALAELADCRACPRDCGVNRLEGKWAACKTGRYAVVGSYFPHFGEEDCLRGWNGSGTIFFSHCNLRCVFCFHPDTPVATTEGMLPISDIFERGKPEGGDARVRSFDDALEIPTREGEPARIAKAFRHRYSGELIRLKPYNCPPLLLTPNHQVFAVLKKYPERVLKIAAGELTHDHRLVVARREPAGIEAVLDLREVLGQELTHFRKAEPGRVSVEALADLFQSGQTSYALAAATGYHPAYVRTLRSRWRRGLLLPERNDSLVVNGLTEEEGRIRFMTERRPGIPARIHIDEPLAWLLGFYCAEGHVTSARNRPNSHRLVFSFAHSELSRAHRVQHLLHQIFGVEARLWHRPATFTVEIGRASLALLFARLCGKGAREKKVPLQILRAERPILESFLEGVLAGDGCERETHRVVSTVSEKMALGLFEIGLLLGVLPSWHHWIPAPTTVIEGRTVNQSPVFIVKFPKTDPETGVLHSRWRQTERGYLVAIHRAERVPYDGYVYNLEIDHPDHSYLAPFVAVANCQNYDISQAIRPNVEPGSKPEEIAAMMLALQRRGCHNINFVTPEHVVPQVIEALAVAIEQGLDLPIVYNTSAYDALHSLQLMEGLVDIYMPDFKYWSAERSKSYMKAEDYPEAARAAIKEMHRQVGDLVLDENGLAKRGLIVRHLVMPGSLDETRSILEWIATEIGPNTYVNLMDQYYPAGKVSEGKYSEIDRKLTPQEFSEAQAIARELGLRNLDERRPHPRLRLRLALAGW